MTQLKWYIYHVNWNNIIRNNMRGRIEDGIIH